MTQDGDDRHLGMKDQTHEGLAVIRKMISGSENLSAHFEKLLFNSVDIDLNELFAQVDQSDYSLVDWIEALVEFDRWLLEQKVEVRPFASMVGYVNCCTFTNAPQINLPSLKVIVYQSLTDFGFDAISEYQL